MKDISISGVLVKATQNMLKEYTTIRFFSNYENNERRVSANVVVNLFESILKEIRASHPNGDRLYLVLYQSYFHPKKRRRHQLCTALGNELVNRGITESTLYRWQLEGTKVFAIALWSNPQFLDSTIKIFTSPYISSHYNEICEEHKKFRNG